MINVKEFEEYLQKIGVGFYTGVPDSQLKAFCDFIEDKYGISDKHIIAPNEGNAVALASGYYLSTGKIGLVYMQNSGLGNAVNPITSLTDPNVYNIPIIYVIGWRGEPGVHDEPQHVKQGAITTNLLELLDIDYKIVNGDKIEIITSQNSKGPSRDWLKIAKSAQAKNKIGQWFKQELKEDNITKGKELMLSFCKAKNIDVAIINTQEYMQAIMDKYGFRDWEGILAAVGHGALKEGQIVNKMQELYDRDHPKILSDEEIIAEVTEHNIKHQQTVGSRSGIVVKGIEDVAVRFSKCCSPVPGDEIVGFVTRGRGISIHRTDCVNIMNLPESDRMRMIDAEWQTSEEKLSEKYLAEIRVFANDRNGLLGDVSRVFTEMNISIIFYQLSLI